MKTKPGFINPADYEFMEQNPYGDADFNEEHNKRVIAETIRKGKLWHAKQDRDYQEKTRERTEAVTRYLKNVTQGKTGDINKYFGRRELARLRGEEIISKLKANPSLIQRLKDKYKNRGKLSSL